MKTRITIYIVSIFFIASTICFSQSASFMGLGDLPGGEFYSDAVGISADGSVIVGNSKSSFGEEAFYWTAAEGMKSLGNFKNNSLKLIWATDISGDGKTIIGYGDTSSVQTYGDGERGFKWTVGKGMEPVGALTGYKNNAAWSVSFDGSVIVGDGGNEPFKLSLPDGMIGLGILPGYIYGRAMAVSADGSVITGSCNDGNSPQTFIWTVAGGMKGLGYVASGPYGTYSFPLAISPDGSVIVGTSSTATGEAAFRWTEKNGMVSIGNLAGKYNTHPGGVSENGNIIVGASFSDPTDPGTAFIWDSVNGMRNLKTVLQSVYRLSLTGWTLHAANDISPDGNIIVGYGTNSSGKTEAFIAVLDTTLITEVRNNHDMLPGKFELYQNYPNPFNPSTTINFMIPVVDASSNVEVPITLKVYDTLGREIATLVNGYKSPGNYEVEFDASSLSSGIYFYCLQTNEMTLQKKMMLIR